MNANVVKEDTQLVNVTKELTTTTWILPAIMMTPKLAVMTIGVMDMAALRMKKPVVRKVV